MKAIVKKITKFDQIDSYGNHSFSIEFDNGDRGFYSTKSAEQTKFVVGVDVEYLIEKKTSAKGKEYFKVTLPQSEQPAFKGGGRPAIDPRTQMIGFAMSYTKDLIVADKVKMSDLGSTFEVIYNEMIGKL